MHEGVVVEWYVSVGDVLAEGAALAAIETDKFATDLECPAHGRLTEILVEGGVTAQVGDVLARLEMQECADASARRGRGGSW